MVLLGKNPAAASISPAGVFSMSIVFVLSVVMGTPLPDRTAGATVTDGAELAVRRLPR
jgi:hypothetical protein